MVQLPMKAHALRGSKICSDWGCRACRCVEQTFKSLDLGMRRDGFDLRSGCMGSKALWKMAKMVLNCLLDLRAISFCAWRLLQLRIT